MQAINKLLTELSLKELLLQVKNVDVYTLGRALRVLEKRCTDREAFRWVREGGLRVRALIVTPHDALDDIAALPRADVREREALVDLVPARGPAVSIYHVASKIHFESNPRPFKN